jgi:hypothetical protein
LYVPFGFESLRMGSPAIEWQLPSDSIFDETWILNDHQSQITSDVERLTHDFPRIFIVAQGDESRVSQMIRAGPL